MSIIGSGNARPFISGEHFKLIPYGKEGVRQTFIDKDAHLKLSAEFAPYQAKNTLVHAHSIREVVAQLCETFGAEEAEQLILAAFAQTKSFGGVKDDLSMPSAERDGEGYIGHTGSTVGSLVDRDSLFQFGRNMQDWIDSK